MNIILEKIDSFLDKQIAKKYKTEPIGSGLSMQQEKLLYQFVDEVNKMNLVGNWGDLSQSHLIKFVRDINNLTNWHHYKNYGSPFIMEPGMLFQPSTHNELITIHQKIKPVIKLAETYLRQITDYDLLIKDVQRHREMIKSYLSMVRIGGSESQVRDFIIKWQEEIGNQWYGFGHLILENTLRIEQRKY